MSTPRADLELTVCALKTAMDFVGNEEWNQNEGPMVSTFARMVDMEEGIPWCLAFVYASIEWASALRNREYNPLREVRHRALVQSLYDYGCMSGWEVSPGQAAIGDLVLYDFGRTSRDWEHVGIVRSPPNESGAYRAIEGNTGNESDREGRYVEDRERSTEAGYDVTFLRYA